MSGRRVEYHSDGKKFELVLVQADGQALSRSSFRFGNGIDQVTVERIVEPILSAVADWLNAPETRL